MPSNFSFLSPHWPELALLGSSAESHLHSDAAACIFKLGLLAERLVSKMIEAERLELPEETTHADRLRILRREGLLPRNVDEILHALRKARNNAVHLGEGSFEMASTLLRMTWHLTVWFMEVYGHWDFAPAPFTLPEADRAAEPAPSVPEELPEAALPPQPRERADEAAGRIALTQEESEVLTAGRVRLEARVLPVVNFCLQQNRIPVLRSLAVVNDGDQPLEHLTLRITASPALCPPLTREIDYLPAESTLELRDLTLPLDGNFLVNQTERVTGLLTFTLLQGDTLLFLDTAELTALAFDEWHGSGSHPELLAAFVTPNHPQTARLMAAAARLLGEWTGDPTLDGYQSGDADRVLTQAAAVYGALQQEGIVYAVPPASFEQVGQRVRLCDTVLEQKLGTCLDLTLLYAAVLEAIGLHPLLILKRGHIFAGLWLEDRSFPEAVLDDAAQLTKRIASGVREVAVVETTLLTAGRSAPFDDACQAAVQELTGENPVELILDVSRARLSGVAPLPQRIAVGDSWRVEEAPVAVAAVEAPRQVGVTIAPEEERPAEAPGKKTQWERRLLDLGLRNTLINLRLTRTMVPLLAPSLDELEDALAEGSDFSLLPRPSDWQPPEDGIRLETLHDAGTPLIQSEFKNRRLRSALTEGELSRALKELYRAARTALEENGANTLYLAMGLLRWYESGRSGKARYAPLLLIPVEMVRRSAAGGYVIRLRDDEPQINITLLEMLQQEFGITVSGLDPLPQDERGVDIRRAFTILRRAVMGQPRWDVLESACLGIFSFSQFVMWNDLKNRSEDLAKNKIVRSLMEGRLCFAAEEMTIGERVSEEDVLLPIPADASQLHAIREAARGRSFVLHGPPGTGKSQTITALIANALAQGKTVLFVAEK
ncbi:MAG: DUF4011 domain-containing protein, partial [Clostridia bacterium]|nr:DUF4011 domain-containing protein [Clostridia bacterium]